MSVARVCEFAKPASLILDKARDLRPELIVLGARGGRVGEFVLGSVSHRVAMHADCTTLIVKEREGPVKRVTVAVEGHEDGRASKPGCSPIRSKSGRSHHRQRRAADPRHRSLQPLPATDWTGIAVRSAEDLIKNLAASLMNSRYTVGTQVSIGDPADISRNAPSRRTC